MPKKLSKFEIERRAAILRDIEKRVEIDGPRVSCAHPSRAKQFMPFAALKGYEEMVAECEREAELRWG